MNKKTKTFPLPLSSVVGRSSFDKTRPSPADKKNYVSTQTAMQNKVAHSGLKDPVKRQTQLLQVGWTESNITRSARSMVERLAQSGIKDKVVLQAMQQIPRHLFLESGLWGQAYADIALPIGSHQTISKPSTVAKMIEALRTGMGPQPMNRILEIGTGCGYQAAILAKLGEEVYSIERIKALHELARRNLRPMRIANLRLQYGDGMKGLPQAAPFAGIFLGAGGLLVPDALLEVLAIGGRLIAPVGDEKQKLQLIKRVAEREWESVILDDCYFVPLQQGTV